MKKLLSILLVCVLSASLFAACGEKDKSKEESYTLTQEETKNNAEKAEQPLEPSENKEVVTKDTAPEVHIINSGSTNNARICYHLKDCKLLNGTDHQKVTWEMIEMIQFRQCPECDPPRYEEYVE